MIADLHAAGEVTIRNGCAALEVSESGYADWQQRQTQAPCLRAQADAALTEQITAIYTESGGSYGSPRIHAVLEDQDETHCSVHRVARLMRAAGLQSVRHRRRQRIQTTNSRHDLQVAPNHLDQDFTASAPDRKWVADTTYIATEAGWLFLAVVLDLYSRKVVGWATATRFNRELVCRALNNALVVRQAPHVLHTDRGVQYASDAHQQLLAEHGILGSMSRSGNCYDNAVVESFFSSLKSELDLTRRSFANPLEAERALFAYIEGFYNPHRLHSSLDYCSPDAFEQATATTLANVFA
jgi:transposase InsO family protein